MPAPSTSSAPPKTVTPFLRPAHPALLAIPPTPRRPSAPPTRRPVDPLLADRADVLHPFRPRNRPTSDIHQAASPPPAGNAGDPTGHPGPNTITHRPRNTNATMPLNAQQPRLRHQPPPSPRHRAQITTPTLAQISPATLPSPTITGAHPSTAAPPSPPPPRRRPARAALGPRAPLLPITPPRATPPTLLEPSPNPTRWTPANPNTSKHQQVPEPRAKGQPAEDARDDLAHRGPAVGRRRGGSPPYRAPGALADNSTSRPAPPSSR